MASKLKPCDSCKSAKATLFCRADSAFLCVNCDTKIHAANKLASRHARVWLCEVCEQAPAHVTCKADDATLCVTCDRDIHSANPLSRRHERVPVHLAPSYDDTTSEVSRSEEAEAASWLLPNLNSSSSHYVLSSAAADDHIMDPYLDPDYYLDPKTEQQDDDDDDDPEEQTTDDGVVPVPATELLANKPPFVYGHGSFSHSVSSSSSLDVDVGVVPDSSVDVSDPYLKSVVQISSADRQARVLRYREKRKNRKFEKTIRYASRKAYAETRPRIKGRFAKRTTQVEIQGRYGVVPSF